MRINWPIIRLLAWIGWLSFIYNEWMNGILADKVGLTKTIQVTTFWIGFERNESTTLHIFYRCFITGAWLLGQWIWNFYWKHWKQFPLTFELNLQVDSVGNINNEWHSQMLKCSFLISIVKGHRSSFSGHLYMVDSIIACRCSSIPRCWTDDNTYDGYVSVVAECKSHFFVFESWNRTPQLNDNQIQG